MTIRSNIGRTVIDIGATDTVILSVTSPEERLGIENMSIHNATGASAITVEVFISPNSTSASGDRIAQYAIDVSSSVGVTELIGQGISLSENIIAKGSVAGLNAKTTVTQFTAGS